MDGETNAGEERRRGERPRPVVIHLWLLPRPSSRQEINQNTGSKRKISPVLQNHQPQYNRNTPKQLSFLIVLKPVTLVSPSPLLAATTSQPQPRTSEDSTRLNLLPPGSQEQSTVSPHLHDHDEVHFRFRLSELQQSQRVST